jgi:pyruvate carboxylase
MAANRSEIAVRIFRAGTELNLRTVAVFAQEDRLCIHRYKADEAYVVGTGRGPVAAYLDIEGIIAVAREKGVDAIHPASSPRTPSSPGPAPARGSSSSAPGRSCSR